MRKFINLFIFCIVLLSSCKHIEYEIKLFKKEFDIKLSSAGYDFYVNKINDSTYEIFNSGIEMLDYFNNNYYVFDDSFIEQINLLNNSNYFDSKSIIFKIYSSIVNNEIKLINLKNVNNNVNIDFIYSGYLHNQIYVYMDFIEVEKKEIQNSKNLTYSNTILNYSQYLREISIDIKLSKQSYDFYKDENGKFYFNEFNLFKNYEEISDYFNSIKYDQNLNYLIDINNIKDNNIFDEYYIIYYGFTLLNDEVRKISYNDNNDSLHIVLDKYVGKTLQSNIREFKPTFYLIKKDLVNKYSLITYEINNYDYKY